MRAEAQMFGRFAAGLPSYLRTPLSAEQSSTLLAESLERREDNFLALAKRAVFERPHSPYAVLLRAAQVAYEDLEMLVRADGVEHALGRLADAGVWVDIDQFKGKAPIERNGVRLEPSAEDFDNPLLRRDFEVHSGGTGGVRRRLAVDLDLLVFEAAAARLFLEAHGLLHRPAALWRPTPPGSSGIKHALRAAKLGLPLERWFDTQDQASRSWPSRLFLATAVVEGKFFGGAVPRPQSVPWSNPEPVVRWLEAKARGKIPGVLSCTVSGAILLCEHARRLGADIAGSVLWVGGEPLTPSKAAILQAAGCETVNGWSLSETGPLGIGCARRAAVDEIHILHSKVAIIARPRGVADSDRPINALTATTLLPTCPKILLNVDVGDQGVLGERSCGCLVEQAGFATHLHTIRNYEKFTVAGVHFHRTDLLRLVEEVLPARHGGRAVDYQLAEEDQGGRGLVSVVVSPEAGAVVEADVLASVYGFLSANSRGDAMMADQWRRFGAVQVIRRRPYVTAAGKTPPLRVIPKD